MMLNLYGQQIPRHKVFISYHHGNDQRYREKFEQLFAQTYETMASRSVHDGDIPDGTNSERVRQIIRDNYLHDSTVTVVLIGTETWKRKHVDWEIGSSIRLTRLNNRSGLLGIILPSYVSNSYSLYEKRTENGSYYNHKTIPPRLHDNIECGFAKIYNWNENPAEVKQWIHDAFLRRVRSQPNNSYPSFVNNRSGLEWQ